MLQVNKLSKFYGPQAILEEVSFVINRGERAALVGPNGCGKSTLLRLIAGLERPDNGYVSLDSEVTLGYLPQGHDSPPGRTVAEEIRSGVEGLNAAQQQMKRLEVQMAGAQGADLDHLLKAYGQAQARFEALGGYAIEYRVPGILAGLGLASLELETPLDQLSGGQRARVGLARLLLAEPTLLLLDEPTNHLDIATLEWLEQFLTDYPGAALIVSHDRTFLDHTVSRILELDPFSHQLTEYAGNYSDYTAAKALTREKQGAAWKDQQAEIRRLAADIRRTHAQAQQNEEATIDSSARRLAKKVAKKAKARERRLERYLESEERVEKPQQTWGLKLEFGDMPRGGQVVLTLEDVGHAFAGDQLFQDVNLTLQHGERIALLGPNGSGKTTLLRLMAGELAPAKGRIRLGANVHLGYMPQQQESLDPELTPFSLIRQVTSMNETETRNFLHFFLFAEDEVFVPIGSLSYGERARLLLAQMIVAGANCLLLDEPVNHLDIPARERFEAALEAFPGTVLAAVHDRTFIDCFATGIWSVEEGTVRRYFDRNEMRRKRG
jgi:ATP-binding cassette subfamily F protein 3